MVFILSHTPWYYIVTTDYINYVVYAILHRTSNTTNVLLCYSTFVKVSNTVLFKHSLCILVTFVNVSIKCCNWVHFTPAPLANNFNFKVTI